MFLFTPPFLRPFSLLANIWPLSPRSETVSPREETFALPDIPFRVIVFEEYGLVVIGHFSIRMWGWAVKPKTPADSECQVLCDVSWGAENKSVPCS